MREFKDIIKGLRAGRQLTQDELAAELGLSRSAISMYERGEREPDFETLEVIADFFNVDMNYLTGWSEDPTNYDDPDLIASIPLSYMEVCGWDVERAFKMMKAVDRDAAEEAKEKAPTLTEKDERITAQNENEEDMLILARHMEPIPEEDRKELKEQFKKSIDLYLKAKGLITQEDK